MNWTSIKEISKIYGKPERTIRHYAAQGKIRVRKDGAKWLCDLNSIHQLGWIQSIELEKVISIEVSQQQVASNVKGKIKKQAAPEEAKKRHSLDTLGVYTELLQLFTKIKPKLASDPMAEDLLSKAILNLALGFYEYQPSLKARHFSEARQSLVHALVRLQLGHLLMAGSDGELLEIKKQIEESLLPGVGGLIRRMEKRSHAREPRASSSTKN